MIEEFALHFGRQKDLGAVSGELDDKWIKSFFLSFLYEMMSSSNKSLFPSFLLYEMIKQIFLSLLHGDQMSMIPNMTNMIMTMINT